MRVKVLKTFRDKDTGSVLRPGLIIYLEDERVEELTSTFNPFVEALKVESEELERELPDFNKMKKEDIVKYAKETSGIELDASTTKAEMIKQLEK